ncbi:MAG: arsenic transporter [Actinobacteria bacterium]|nr:arsenic transporter [Actinomycetota bacterium]MCA1719618.1 arsenic transporter [Actinomycetota bacterium]
MWLAAALLGTLTLLTGLLPLDAAADVLQRLAPVLVFLVAVTVLAELADAAQVFDVVAVRAARLARGRTPLLFGLVAVLATATTVVLSLDTTAVLGTPVVLALAAQLELDALPFALLLVWLANTASLLLPVSNLTNLLAVDRLELSTAAYARATAPAAAAAVATTVLLLGLAHRRRLRGRYPVPPLLRPADRPLFVAGTSACLLLVPALLLGLPVAVAASGAAAVVVATAVVRDRTLLAWRLVPWRLVVLVVGLFLVVQAVGPHGLDGVLRDATGGPLRTAGVAAALANVANNLPAYLAVERVVPQDQLLALLVGVNVGPLVLPWGSLATLLWADRCRARGVRIGWRRFALTGLVGVPLLLLATVPLLPASP